MGKSAFIAHCADVYKKSYPQSYTIEHYIGGGGGVSSSLESMLLRILSELKERFQLTEELPKSDELKDEFASWLFKIPKDSSVAIFIDALNQLTDKKIEDVLRIFPNILPENLKIVFSSIEPFSLPNAKELTVSPLTNERKKAFIQTSLEKVGKTLNDTQLNHLLNSKESENPLYLKIVLDKLKVFGIYEKLEDKIKELVSYKTIEELLKSIIYRIEKEYDNEEEVFKEILSYISCSRDGMSEDELLEIITAVPIYEHQDRVNSGKQLILTRQELSHMLLAIEEHLVSKEGLLNFLHIYIRNAVNDIYLKDDKTVYKFRNNIAKYFEKELRHYTKETKRIAKELPYQLHLIKDEERLLNAIGNARVFLYGTEDDWELEMHGYYLSIESIQDKEDRLYDSLLKYEPMGDEDENEVFLSSFIGLYFYKYLSYEKAEPLLERALEFSSKKAGDEHTLTLCFMGNLAGLYESQGKYQKAEPLYVETLELSEKVLGKEYPNTLAYMNNLAALYRSQGNYQKAEPLYIETLGLMEKILKKKHPITLKAMNGLAELYIKMNKKEKSLKLFNEAYEIAQSLLGESHPTTQQIKKNLEAEAND